MSPDVREIDRGDGWKIEERISSDGTIRRRYFYKNRQAPRIQIKSKIAQQLAAYVLIEKDLRNVLVWIDEINKLFPQSERLCKTSISSDRKRFNVIKGLFVASLISYGKCFTACEGRKTKLDKKIIDIEYHEVHDQVMHMRHNFAAHSGVDSFEEVKVAIVLPPKKHRGMLPILFKELIQADIMLYDNKEVDMKALIEHVQKKVFQKIEKLSDKIMTEEIVVKGEDYWYRLAKKGI